MSDQNDAPIEGMIDFEALSRTSSTPGKQAHEIADTDAKNSLDEMSRCALRALQSIEESLGTPAPYCFERCAIILRKKKLYEAEAQVCRSYMEACDVLAEQVDFSRRWDPRSNSGGYGRLLKRLSRAEHWLGRETTLHPNLKRFIQKLRYHPHRPNSFTIQDPETCGTPMPHDVFEPRDFKMKDDQPLSSWMAICMTLHATKPTHGLKVAWEGFGDMHCVPGDLRGASLDLDIFGPRCSMGWMHVSMEYPGCDRQSESVLIAVRKGDDDLGILGFHALLWVHDSDEIDLTPEGFADRILQHQEICERDELLHSLKSVVEVQKDIERNGPWSFQSTDGGATEIRMEI